MERDRSHLHHPHRYAAMLIYDSDSVEMPRRLMEMTIAVAVAAAVVS